MPITVDEKKLSELIKNAVREAVEQEFNAEFRKLMLLLLPRVSDEEQREIEEIYGENPGDDDVAYSEVIEI